MTSLVLTITETLRYRGKIGQWAWVLHRVAGLGTLLFLILHIVDTSWATFYPELYAKAVDAYKTPLFTAGEFVLVACVVYHALNGFRIALFDYRPQWWRRQADAARLVLLATVVLLIPVFFIMAGHVVTYYNERVFGAGKTFDLGLDKVIESQVPFAVGTVVVLGAAFVLSVVSSLVSSPKTAKKGLKKNVQQKFIWRFMRISGVLIIPLVFGHLAMVHVINGVFDITKVGHTPLFTNLGPNMVQGVMEHPELLGTPVTTASNFVAMRWNTMLAGVYIWRVYDILLLALVVTHGFNGLRYVINDYFRNGIVNRTLQIAGFGTMIGLIIVGGLAILQTVPATTEKMLNARAATTQVVTAEGQTKTR